MHNGTDSRHSTMLDFSIVSGRSANGHDTPLRDRMVDTIFFQAWRSGGGVEYTGHLAFLALVEIYAIPNHVFERIPSQFSWTPPVQMDMLTHRRPRTHI